MCTLLLKQTWFKGVEYPEENKMRCPNKCSNQRVTPDGISTITAVYFPPIYNEVGVNINPDRNTMVSYWKCLFCGCRWVDKNGKIKILEKGSVCKVSCKVVSENKKNPEGRIFYGGVIYET